MPSKHNRHIDSFSRRDFLKALLRSSLLAGGSLTATFMFYSNRPMRQKRQNIHTFKDYRIEVSDVYPRMVIVRGKDPEKMLDAALYRLGGIERFVKRGDRVLIKPNASWDRQPEQAATTNPHLVAAMVKACLQAGASEVWITDNPVNNPYRSLHRSLIGPKAEQAGAKVRLPDTSDFWLTAINGTVLKEWPVIRYFHQADKVINMPIVKHHSLSGCTIAMKNWYGVLGGRRNQLHQQIDRSIVDLAMAIRPTLTVIDATRVLMRNGPTGGSLSDVSVENTILAGTDEVALDAYACGFLGLDPEKVGFIRLAHDMGLGNMNWSELRYEEIIID